MKNEAGEHIKEFYHSPNGKRAYHPKAQLLNEDDAKEAVNLALEQVGKKAKEKHLGTEPNNLESNSDDWINGYEDGLLKATHILDKIIKTLKL